MPKHFRPRPRPGRSARKPFPDWVAYKPNCITSHLPTYQSLLKVPSVIKGQEFFAEILKFATSRPPLPVNAQLQAALDQAVQSIQIGGSNAESALKSAQQQMAENTKQYCPFKLPPKTAIG